MILKLSGLSNVTRSGEKGKDNKSTVFAGLLLIDTLYELC